SSKALHNTDGLHRHARHAANEVHDVAGVADLVCPVIGVIDDAGGLVLLHLVAIDQPRNRGAGPQHVFIRLCRDTHYGDLLVVDQLRDVVDVLAGLRVLSLGPTHLGAAPGLAVGFITLDLAIHWPWVYILVIYVQIDELLASCRE